MPLLLRTRARHLPRSARQLLHPASSHAAIARIPVLFRALQPARTRTALRRHPHNGIPISIGARFSSINPIPTCPGHVPHGRPPLLAGTARNRLLLIIVRFLLYWAGRSLTGSLVISQPDGAPTKSPHYRVGQDLALDHLDPTTKETIVYHK